MAKEKTADKKNLGQVEKERAEFRELIAKNPNYFGKSPASKKKVVSKICSDTKYEEIRCVGFYPELDLLEAIIDIKLPYGYSGDLCTAGSYEYIRFYIDWDGDGDFDEPDEDMGIVSLNVHDIPDEKAPCLKKTKPLSYALSLKIDSAKKHCKFPQLVKVRAILSWDNPPSPMTPDFPVVWGHVVEKWIQIREIEYKLKDVLDYFDFKKLKLTSSMLDLEASISKSESLTPADLKKLYKKEDVPDHRWNFTAAHQAVEQIKMNPAVLAALELDPQFITIKDAVKLLLKTKYNTDYEQLGCVGLDYDREWLEATISVKRPCGYGGGLCSDGSYEHVAFWAYIHDEIEQQCIWRHLGTTSVNVHDIKSIPKGGLQYAVYLPVDFSQIRQQCSNPKTLRVRAVLSWSKKPDPADPFQIPAWGNSVDALIQIKPGETHKPGERKPYIWSVGNMAVESIDGNPYTTLSSSLGNGYANGVSLGAGFSALESPFGGRIAISGKITNPPDNPTPAQMLKYKVQYRKSGSSWKDISDKFRIWLRIDGIPSGFIDQTVDSAGYFTYREDDALLSTPPKVEVQNDMLAVWHTPVSDGDGLYRLRILLEDPGAPPQIGVPAGHVASPEIQVMVDNKKPAAAISLDMGACQKFTVGDTITGTFTATDAHIWRYTISVLPSVPTPPVITPNISTYPALTAPGVTNATFQLTTTAGPEMTTPCGYVLRLWVRDRTILNNSFPGNKASADVGLCLLEKEEKK